MIKIAVDIQGADNSENELIDGVVSALSANPDLYVHLVGDRGRLTAALGGKTVDESRLNIVHAPETITNSDDPVAAFGQKKNSSLVKAMELIKSEGDIGAFTTFGATGALFVSAMMSLKKITDCPALVCEPKHADGTPFCIVDCGANVDCRAEKLVSFARTGVAYMKTLGVKQPKVALLSNGAEDKKGSQVVKKANELLRMTRLDFIGNVEGTDVMTGDADVVVCEGFSGNVLLKTIEGVAKAVLAEQKKTLDALSGGSDAKRVRDMWNELYKKYDYTQLGGATLLGFDIPIVKGHGAATAETVQNCVQIAYTLAKNGLSQKLKAEFI